MVYRMVLYGIQGGPIWYTGWSYMVYRVVLYGIQGVPATTQPTDECKHQSVL
jgi:hypothetical protein